MQCTRRCSLASALLGSRLGRRILLGYTLALHALIFYAMWHFSHGVHHTNNAHPISSSHPMRAPVRANVVPAHGAP